ncbi:Helix-turn-helix domain-containing protein [Deinococcus marmoris]
MGLKRWVRRQHIQSAYQQGEGRTAPPYIHLDDARHFLHGQQHLTSGTSDALPRVKGEELRSSSIPSQVTKAAGVDLDWQLARQAAWPMTVDRLAEAVHGSRSTQARQQTQRTLRRWEAQGRVVCFARGLYDLVRSALILDPERYGRSVLPREDLQKLHAHHPEIAHWAARSLAAAWRAYSRFYAGMLLPVANRGEPTFLEYLMVCQLNPGGMPGEVNARYEELCQAAAFYRLVPAPSQGVPETEQPELSVENIEAGLIDFKAAAEATRLKMQRNFSKGQTLGLGRRTTASKPRGMQENV